MDLIKKGKGACYGIFLFLFIGGYTFSQETRFGIKAGPNYSTVVGDLTEGINPRFSGHIGVFASFEFSRNFTIQPELLYSSQGFRFNTDLAFIDNFNPVVNDPDFITAVQFNYLSVPVIAQFGLSDRIAVEFGPQFAFLINQVTKIKNFDGNDANSLNERETSPGNFQLDYGAVVGVVFWANESLSFSPRFYLGLRNRLNGALGNIQNYNAALQLSVNYAFL